MPVPPFVIEAVTQKLGSDVEDSDGTYFARNLVLVLRARTTNHVFQLSYSQLKAGVIFGRRSGAAGAPMFLDMTQLDGLECGVSREHARVAYKQASKSIFVADLRSANGTFINGERLGVIEVRALRHGDKLRFGRLEFGVTILQAPT